MLSIVYPLFIFFCKNFPCINYYHILNRRHAFCFSLISVYSQQFFKLYFFLIIIFQKNDWSISKFINEKNKIGRREVIGGLSAGLATIAISPVFGSPDERVKDPLQPHHWHLKIQLLNSENPHSKVSFSPGRV